MSKELKVSYALLKCVNQIGDYFEYWFESEKDKKYVMSKIDDMTKLLKALNKDEQKWMKN